jgi:HAD superfamily phosphoserine phosphatase-like hydrolase
MPKLIVFDVEGVLVPKRRYLLFEASRRLSIIDVLRMLWYGLLYESGLTLLETAMRKIYKQLRGLQMSDLFHLYKKMPLLPGVREVFAQLKRLGCKTALISSGLPQSFVEDLAMQLGADYAFGLDLEVVDGRLTGVISGDVIKPEGKALVLKRIQEKEGLGPQDCAVVADDRNNLPVFTLCARRIGYNPDFLVANKSDIAVKGDLREVLPALTGISMEIHSLSRRDVIRETIHISGFFVAFFTMYLALSNYLAVSLIMIIVLLYSVSELARMFGLNFPVVSTITWKATTQPEIYEFVTAPIFFALGIILTLLLFPPPLSYASIAIFTLGDASATLFGKTFGIHAFPYNKGKKIEGTVLGFLMASLGALVFVSPLKALVGAAVGMIVESLPTPVNDNITIPLAAGLTLLFLP